MSCIFCDIVAGSRPCKKVYEDEHVFAFHDIRPAAPVHILVVPKKHIATLFDATPEDLTAMGHLVLALPNLAKDLGLDAGFKTHINTGHGGGQEVFHVHFHLLGYPRR